MPVDLLVSNKFFLIFGRTLLGVGSSHFYLPSVEVKEYKPPYYKIAGYFYDCYEDSRSYVLDKIYYQIKYNWNTKESWHLEYYSDSYELLNAKNYYWKKDRTNNDGIKERRKADALFRAAYKMNFYGY